MPDDDVHPSSHENELVCPTYMRAEGCLDHNIRAELAAKEDMHESSLSIPVYSTQPTGFDAMGSEDADRFAKVDVTLAISRVAYAPDGRYLNEDGRGHSGMLNEDGRYEHNIGKKEKEGAIYELDRVVAFSPTNTGSKIVSKMTIAKNWILYSISVGAALALGNRTYRGTSDLGDGSSNLRRRGEYFRNAFPLIYVEKSGKILNTRSNRKLALSPTTNLRSRQLTELSQTAASVNVVI